MLDEFHGAAADGHELRIGIGILNLRHQEIQTTVDYVKRGPVVVRKGKNLTMIDRRCPSRGPNLISCDT